jgi:transposase
MDETGRVIGIDVSKAKLDIAFSDRAQMIEVANDMHSIKALGEELSGEYLVVMEASGGYEALPAAVLTAAGPPVAVVNARHVRDFAGSTGRLAKTDRLDARILVEFGLRLKPAPRAVKTAE